MSVPKEDEQTLPGWRLLVTGSRTWTGRVQLRAVLLAYLRTHPDLVIVHGGCKTGADAIAADWAEQHHVPQETHRADWSRGRRGGRERNQRMVDSQPRECVAFVHPCSQPRCRRILPHDSHGTDHCATAAERAGIPTYRIKERP
jgi:YspA, cpYpsA-related SLOG family